MRLSKLEATRQVSEVARLTLSPSEAAKALGVGRNTLTKLLETGQITSVRAGRRVLIPKAALERFLQGGQ